MRLGPLAAAAALLLAPALVGAAPAAGSTAPAAAASAGLTVSVSGARLVPGGQQVVLTGRYSCGPFAPGSDYGVVDLTLTRAGTTGYGYLPLAACDGKSRRWVSTVDSVGGPFSTGKATVTGSGYACDPAGAPCQHGSFGPSTVRIRR